MTTEKIKFIEVTAWLEGWYKALEYIRAARQCELVQKGLLEDFREKKEELARLENN